VLSNTDTVNEPLPEPDAGPTNNHDWFDDADHDVFDVTDTDVVEAAADAFHEDNPKPHEPGGGWVTVTVLDICGLPDVVLTVTVADRETVPVFANADNDRDPLPELDAGVTVNHVWFDDADHDVFDNTDTEVESADEDGTPHEDVPNTTVGGDG